ncbi:MAG: HU family DNA-binding protein [Pseudomonadota bacterium]|nr:HU family DNA-binding protein [Pseudomonadota bacterium]
MHKPELAAAMAARLGCRRAEMDWALNAILDQLTLALVRGESVSLPGFGRFVLRERAARQGRHPGTGVALDLPARRSLAFKPGKTLREAL